MIMKKYLIITLTLISVLSFSCSNSNENGQTKSGGKEYWTCPMHPEVHKDRFGSCPICGMDLVKKVEDDSLETDSDNNAKEMLTLNNSKQVLANVSTVKVKKERLLKELSVYSYLDIAEQNQKTIPAKFNGRIEKLFVDKTGDYIKKGQALFEVYSPDLAQAENEYLISLNKGEENNSLVELSKKKLELMGLTSQQIDEIENSGRINLTVTYYSPINGTVIEKKVQEGMYVSEGTPIYEVAELSTLWNIAEVNEADLSNVKVGSNVKLKLNAYPAEEFLGKVIFIYPVVNPQTRTVKVRNEFASHNNRLKPQMYGQTFFSSDDGPGLLVLSDAIMFSGKRNVVWVKTSDKMFEARDVQVGQKFGDKYHILSRLSEGDEVAVTGGYLIDSESQLKNGMVTGDKNLNDNSPETQNDKLKTNSSKHTNH